MKVNFLIFLSFMFIFTLPLLACGKKGTPLNYDNGDYPKSYPTN